MACAVFFKPPVTTLCDSLTTFDDPAPMNPALQQQQQRETSGAFASVLHARRQATQLGPRNTAAQQLVGGGREMGWGHHREYIVILLVPC